MRRTIFTAAVALIAVLAARTPAQAATLTVGSPAPALEVEAWLKGEPVAALGGGRIHVVEFWATWCAPCIAGMPRLTRMQAGFGDTVTVIGVNIWEERADSLYTDLTRARVAQFVADNEAKLGYRVAYDGRSQAATKAWMLAAGLDGIPCGFVVDRAGVIAHIGHPLAPAFEKAIRGVIDGTHDLAAARSAHEADRDAVAADRAARAAGRARIKAVVDLAVPLARAGNHAAAEAACDTVQGLGAAFGPNPGDDIKIQVFRSLWAAPDADAAHAFVDHLLEADALGSPLGYGGLAWSMVDPEYGVKGADPARAVRCSERSLEAMAAASDTTGLAMMKPLLLDTHATALAAVGRLEEAIAAQAQAVELEANATMKAQMLEKLAEYRSR